MQKSSRFFGDECIISRSGLYTFAHYYCHPETDRRVILVGMSHVGDEDYFEKVKQILAGCDLVLFENIRKDEDSSVDPDTEEASMRKQVFEGEVEEVFSIAQELYGKAIDKVLNLLKEEDVFDFEYAQNYWVCGDIVEPTEEQSQEYLNAFHSMLQDIDSVFKRKIVEHVKKALQKIDQGQFTRRDLRKGLLLFLSDPAVNELIFNTFAKPRDLYCFEQFDRSVQERNPEIVGIKFGGGHIAFLRSLLEERGYKHQKSVKLRNLSIK